MNIPKVDYSPIYNALNVQKQASDAEYNLKLFDLQKQGQTADALIGLASLGLDIAKTVISIREQREMESAKSYAFTVSDELSKKATDLIYNDQYSVNTESAQYDYGMASQELTGGDQNFVKTQSITLDSDYDEYFNDRLAVVDQKYKSNTVKEWLKDQLRVAYQEGKNRALSYAYKKEEEDYVNLFTSNLNSAIKQSIATGNKGLYEAQVSSSKFSAKQKKALLMDAETQFTKGTREKDISSLVKTKGTVSAFEYVESLPIEESEKQYFRGIVSNAKQIADIETSSQIAEYVKTQRENKVPDEAIAKGIETTMASMPDEYKAKYVESLYLSGQQKIVQNIIPYGYDKALQYIDSLPESANKDALRQSASTAYNQYKNQIDATLSDALQKHLDNGGSYAEFRASLKHEQIGEEYKDSFEVKLDKKQAIYANQETFYDRPYLWGNIARIRSRITEVQEDKTGRYAGLEDDQKGKDLEELHRMLDSAIAQNNAATKKDEDTMETSLWGVVRQYQTGVKDAQGNTLNYETTIEYIDQFQPYLKPETYNALVKAVETYTWPQYASILDDSDKTFTSIFETEKNKNWLKQNSLLIKSTLAHNKDALKDFLREKERTPDEVRQFMSDLSLSIIGPLVEWTSKQFETDPASGDVTIDGQRDINKFLKNISQLDSSVYEKVSGSGVKTLMLPPGYEARFEQYTNWLVGGIEKLTGMTGTPSYERQGSDIAANIIISTPDGNKYRAVPGSRTPQFQKLETVNGKKQWNNVDLPVPEQKQKTIDDIFRDAKKSDSLSFSGQQPSESAQKRIERISKSSAKFKATPDSGYVYESAGYEYQELPDGRVQRRKVGIPLEYGNIWEVLDDNLTDVVNEAQRKSYEQRFGGRK